MKIQSTRTCAIQLYIAVIGEKVIGIEMKYLKPTISDPAWREKKIKTIPKNVGGRI